MPVRVNPDSGFIISNADQTYSLAEIYSMRVPCHEANCSALMILSPAAVGDVNNQKVYAVGGRWSCANGHGSPDHI